MVKELSNPSSTRTISAAVDSSCIRLFSDHSHYSRESRSDLADILRPFWKDRPFTEEERKTTYGISKEDFAVVDDIAAAELAVLPVSWNHYLERKEINRARDFIQTARRVGRPVLSYITGDAGVTVPKEFDDVFVVRASGNRSRKRKRQLAQPVFFDDPLKTFSDLETYGREQIAGSLPCVGFCGQASVRMMKVGLDGCRTFWRNCLYHLGLKLDEPQPISSTARLRAMAMETLAQSPLVSTNFVARTKYRGGATTDAERKKTTREFYQNIAETDYTLCVRGGGNFSKRLYETLAMGRIPVLLDTDCLLPFEHELDWERYIVRANVRELTSLPDKIASHFNQLADGRLEQHQRECRKLWQERLTFAGFHRTTTRWILTNP